MRGHVRWFEPYIIERHPGAQSSWISLAPTRSLRQRDTQYHSHIAPNRNVGRQSVDSNMPIPYVSPMHAFGMRRRVFCAYWGRIRTCSAASDDQNDRQVRPALPYRDIASMMHFYKKCRFGFYTVMNNATILRTRI